MKSKKTKFILFFFLMNFISIFTVIGQERVKEEVKIEIKDRKFFINSNLIIPDVTEGLDCFWGVGIGFILNSRLSIQGAGVFRNFKEKDEGIFNTSLSGFILDLKYNLNNKRLCPYLLISEGIFIVNRKWIFKLPPEWTHESKHSDFYFGTGVGLGLRMRLNKLISAFIETRGYLILYENSRINIGGFYPFIIGLSINL